MKARENRRKYLSPKDVIEKWRPYFDFEHQQMHKGALSIPVTCPTCGLVRLWACCNVRSRKLSPYCIQHKPSGKEFKPLLPEELPLQWREFYDFSRQEIHRDSGGRKPHIWARCPICGKERWQNVQNIRRLKVRPLCQHCAVYGRQSYNWQGGKPKSYGNYQRIALSRLSPEDRVLAEPMADNSGRVKVHRLAMAKILGRPLRRNEVVHHLNGSKNDNRPENLRLLKIKDHHSATGDDFYQKWQEALAEIERLKSLLGAQG